jgi:hypothetical protein
LTVGGRLPKHPSVSQLTSRPDSVLSKCRRSRHPIPTQIATAPLEQLDAERNRIWGAAGLQRTQLTRIVASGTTHRIAFLHALHPDCTASGDVHVRVTQEPEHGKIEIIPMSDFARYSKDNIRSRCNQHKVKGVLVNYKADKKYVGDDAFVLLVIYPQGLAEEGHFNISVR